MPIVRETVLSGILAHWWQHDPVSNRHRTYLERSKQMRVGIAPQNSTLIFAARSRILFFSLFLRWHSGTLFQSICQVNLTSRWNVTRVFLCFCCLGCEPTVNRKPFTLAMERPKILFSFGNQGACFEEYLLRWTHSKTLPIERTLILKVQVPER